jgi:hypothetical protein
MHRYIASRKTDAPNGEEGLHDIRQEAEKKEVLTDLFYAPPAARTRGD